MFSILSLTNKEQALGLPEGSIRAVIALSLIVLFAILSVFLYQNISKGGELLPVGEMSAAERMQFIQSNPNARDIQAVPVKGKTDVYDVSYRSTNAASEDFAKQLLVLLGTLMTAITSFYLGAGTVTSAVKAGSEAGASAGPPPTLSSVTPETYSPAKDGPLLHLEIAGSQPQHRHPRQNPQGRRAADRRHQGGIEPEPTLTCELDVSQATAGSWDVEVDDGGSRSAKLPGKLPDHLSDAVTATIHDRMTRANARHAQNPLVLPPRLCDTPPGKRWSNQPPHREKTTCQPFSARASIATAWWRTGRSCRTAGA